MAPSLRGITKQGKNRAPRRNFFCSEVPYSALLATRYSCASTYFRRSLEARFEKYGIAQRDGTSFIMPGHEATELLAKTAGDKRALEQALGLPENFLDTNALVRVDIPDPKQLNLRIPSGNEAGANEFWIPGGKLPDGNSEAVIDAAGMAAKMFNTASLL